MCCEIIEHSCSLYRHAENGPWSCLLHRVSLSMEVTLASSNYLSMERAALLRASTSFYGKTSDPWADASMYLS